MREKLPLILVLSVVFVSGCLGGGTTDTGPDSLGLIPTTFEPDLSSLRSGDSFSLFLDVENTGGASARNAYAFLHGISIGGGSDAFALEGGNNPQLLGTELVAPDPEAGLQGDVATATWDLQAPSLPGGVTFSYTPRARVFYKYQTTAVSTISVLSESEHRRLREQGESIPSQTQTTVSKGPFGVTIEARAPVVVRSEDDKIRLVVNAEIREDGSAFHPDYNGYEDDGNVPQEETATVRVRMSAPGVSASQQECAPLANDDGEIMSLRGGTSLSFSCELSPGTVTGRRDIPVQVVLNYGFFTDAQTQLTVAGEGS